MKDEQIDINEFDHDEITTPEERTEQFKALLGELDETPLKLALRLNGLGDFRSPATITRSIQRMAAGDTIVSGEMLVILKLLVHQQRLRDEKESEVPWKQQPNKVWSANIDGFQVTLHPKTKDRWHIHLVYMETGYSPAWQPWPTGIEAAKKKAVLCAADGLLEVLDLKAAQLKKATT